MAEALTYTSLLSDVEEYCERRDDLLSWIPRFVMLAENRISSEVKGLGQLEVVTSTLSAGDQMLEKPQHWRETAIMTATIGSQIKILRQRSYDYCKMFNIGAASDVPRYYADYGYEHWYIVPAGSANSSLEISFFKKPDPLDSGNETNWTTQYAPQLLLYATLLEASPFLKNPANQQTWQGMYDRAAAAVTLEGERRTEDHVAKRKPQ